MAAELRAVDFEELWDDAVGEYVREVGQNPSFAAKIKTAADLFAHIKASDAEFSAFRHKHERLLSALRGFAGPITVLAKVSSTLASGVDFGAASSAILGAIVHLLKACDGVTDAYDWVEQLFHELRDFSERLTAYIQTPRLDPVLRRKIVAILAVLLKVIGHSQKLIREHRFREYLRVTFLGKDKTTKTLIDELNRILGSEQRYTVGVTYASTQRTEEQVSKLLENYEADRNKNAQAEDKDRLRNTLSDTSAPADVEEIFIRNERALLPGTGKWLETENFFQAWMSREAVILWIVGGGERAEEDPVAYFFVKENNEKLRDAKILLKTLAWQVANQDDEFERHAIAVCREHSRTITAERIWENLFLGYYNSPDSSQNPRAVTIVIDGLDEATTETRQAILGLMKDLVLSSAPNVNKAGRSGIRLAIIGRGDLRSDMDFKRLGKNCVIEVSHNKNRDDINNYICQRLGELAILQEMRKMKPDGLKRANKEGSKILRRVAEGADGVFLWAKLLLDSLAKKDLPHIEAILASPPRTLDKMIWSVFDRLARDEELDQVVVRKMLMFMTHARRPLLFGELDIVTSLPTRKPNYLLWKHTRGRLSSVFDLKFPGDSDPDDSDAEDDQGFSFSYDGDGDDSDASADSDSDGIFSTASSFSRKGKLANPGVEADTNQDAGRDAEREDLLSHLTGDKQRTRVAFCHIRIRDFLVREGNPKTRENPPLSIVPGMDDVQADMTIACLGIFQLELSRNESQRFLCDYPLCHLPFHLEGVDRASVPPEKAGKIIEGLHWLFRKSEGILALVSAPTSYPGFHSSKADFWSLWVATDKYLRLVQSWLGSVVAFRDHVSSCDEDAVAWMLEAANSLEALLRPAIATVSKKWLSRPGFDSNDYLDKGEFECWLVNGWLAWVETGATFSETTPAFTFSSVAPNRLEYLANHAGLERDTHWYTLLGWALMMGQHYEAAVAYCHKAIALDPKTWVALEALAHCAGEQGQYRDAIDWQNKAIAALPQAMSFVKGYLLPLITEWSNKPGESERAFEVARNGFDADPGSIPAAITLLRELSDRGMSAEVLEKLRYLGSCSSRVDFSPSLLVRLFFYLQDIFDVVGWAYAMEGRPQFVLDALDQAWSLVDKGDNEWIKIFMPYMIAWIKYTYYGLWKDCVAPLEAFLERLEQSDGLKDTYARDREYARNLLAQLHFDAAVDSWTKSPTSRSSGADKLKGLATAVSTGFADDYEGFDLFHPDYPAMLWGHWQREFKGAAEAKWRKSFRARLLEQLNTIDDDDPTNDKAGLESLAMSLFHAGDRGNAGAIMAILFLGLSKKGGEENEEEEDEEEDEEDEDEPSGTTETLSDKSSDEDIEVNSKKPEEHLAEKSEGGDINRRAETPVDNPAASPSPESRSSNTPEQAPPEEAVHTTDIIPDQVRDAQQPYLNLNMQGRSTRSYTCGNCRRHFRVVAEMYVCEVCSSMTNWCDECLPLLKDEERRMTMVEFKCNPRHPFYRAWPVSEEAKHVAAVSFEKGVIIRREWLKKLRQEWWE